MGKIFLKVKLYTLIFSAVIVVFMPLKVFAINTGFYSANDILFYNPDDKCGATGGGIGASGPVFDLAKLSSYEKDTGEPSGDKNDSGGTDIWAQGKWAQTQNAKDRAISLGVNETEMVNKTRDEVIAMIAAEVARQYNTLSDKHGTTLAQAQQAILFYQQFEDNSFQLFNSSGWPSYTFDTSGAALDILSLTNDKFAGGNGKNKRAAASYDIKYAIYLGVQEHMQRFQSSGVKGVGEDRWRFALGVVFWPSNASMSTWQEMRYWDDTKTNSPAWAEWATYVSGLSGSSGTSGTSASSSSGSATSSIPYELPAASGRTETEEAIDASGRVPSGGGVTFSNLASKGQAYRDYYITMRWNYTSWYWSGDHKGMDNEQFAWMAKEPRIVLVTNPRTGKSIYAAALEAGPAPWTGLDSGSNNNPKQGWVNPQKGTPAEYKGRVSGFPPIAIDALGGAIHGTPDGGGDVLTYQWAPDQSVTPGPTDASAVAGTGNGCGSTAATGGVASGDASWPDNVEPRGKGWTLKNGADYSGTQCGEGFRDATISDIGQLYEYNINAEWGVGSGNNDRDDFNGALYTHPKNKYIVRLCVATDPAISYFGSKPVSSLITQKLKNLLIAAKSAGFELAASSTFRTYGHQVHTWAGNPNPKMVAHPGGSQHERGIAIDFADISQYDWNNPKVKWLGNDGNAVKYGFYNYDNEAWHWSMGEINSNPSF